MFDKISASPSAWLKIFQRNNNNDHSSNNVPQLFASEAGRVSQQGREVERGPRDRTGANHCHP
jgi:hypothetical protein